MKHRIGIAGEFTESSPVFINQVGIRDRNVPFRSYKKQGFEDWSGDDRQGISHEKFPVSY
ncbi:MAG TPA: hypothetical protein DIW81_05015 [Planctomycetaceae bacterium]|nr:hypothetical protein [Rubinisphaera sp.]HCS50943.1 hypothetical protein [Planctomycetaceae bacterium]